MKNPLEIPRFPFHNTSMDDVRIVEVTTKSQLRKFVNYPNELYRNTEQFVPAFYGDDLADWDANKNPAFQYCEARAFLAYRGNRIVGRIGAILNHRANETWHTKRMRFSQVDFIDDPEVSSRLFETVEQWAREKGCTQVHGPLGFCDMDREGMLVEGYDKRSMFITYYNFPYYNEHLARLGYAKDIDWIEFKVMVPDVQDRSYERLHRLAGMAMERGRYHKAVVKRHADYKPYIVKVFQLVNIAYAHLYGVVELGQDQIEKYANKFVPLINPDYCCLVLDEHDELAGFGVCCPSVAQAMQKCRGKLFPFGWIGVLGALRKNTAIDMLLIAVRPELQNRGVNAIVMDHMMESCIKNGIVYAETGPHLETNSQVIGQWKGFDVQQHKRRRCYVKDIDHQSASS